jgi:hypothetical protein
LNYWRPNLWPSCRRKSLPRLNRYQNGTPRPNNPRPSTAIVQCDEIWSFVGAKQKNAMPELVQAGRAGDVWTWTALDADTKLMVSGLVGSRDSGTAFAFIEDLAYRVASRTQISTRKMIFYSGDTKLWLVRPHMEKGAAVGVMIDLERRKPFTKSTWTLEWSGIVSYDAYRAMVETSKSRR